MQQSNQIKKHESVPQDKRNDKSFKAPAKLRSLKRKSKRFQQRLKGL